MGNACLKSAPELSLTCINSGEMSSCCHNSINEKCPNGNDKGYDLCDDRKGIFIYIFTITPLYNGCALKAKEYISPIFIDYNECKKSALKRIDQHNCYPGKIELNIFENNQSCGGICNHFYTVFQTVLDTPTIYHNQRASLEHTSL